MLGYLLIFISFVAIAVGCIFWYRSGGIEPPLENKRREEEKDPLRIKARQVAKEMKRIKKTDCFILLRDLSFIVGDDQDIENLDKLYVPRHAFDELSIEKVSDVFWAFANNVPPELYANMAQHGAGRELSKLDDFLKNL